MNNTFQNQLIQIKLKKKEMRKNIFITYERKNNKMLLLLLFLIKY